MKGVIAGLFVFMMMLSFVVAQGSSTRTDFYIKDEVNTEGYEESDANVRIEKSKDWIAKVIYWALIIIAIALIIRLLQGVNGKKSKRSKKTKTKKSRRKKK